MELDDGPGGGSWGGTRSLLSSPNAGICLSPGNWLTNQLEQTVMEEAANALAR